MLTYTRREESGVVVVELFGRFEYADKQVFLKLTEADTDTKVVVDLTLLDRISLEGVQALYGLCCPRGESNRNVALVRPKNRFVVAKLVMTGFSSVFTFYETVPEAIAALKAA